MDSGEADDITQEAFLKAFENLERFRQEASLRTWLCRITTNVYLSKKRNQRKHESISLGEMKVPDRSCDPERTVIRRDFNAPLSQTAGVAQYSPGRCT
ncbi:RNA polymerase sigma factor [Syntrophothermus sp.]|uniref:RNA polymerase sigma factor n=1 Tax=Syntrophothermus sp. TaxID=2736299 RepID=UPI00338D4161